MVDLASLLLRGESESLDFKRDQYKFKKATDEEKSELLKDILAMANAWRDVDAVILIGVDAPNGQPPSVVGITDHIDDAALQQFVNYKTQRPVKFSYATEELDGKTVGVIRIPVQERPFYLKQAFGGLESETVYVRRGSSTTIAKIDEIAKMGGAAAPVLAASEIDVQFCDGDARRLLGRSLALSGTVIRVDKPERIPDYEKTASLGNGLELTVGLGNRNYYREYVEYVQHVSMLRPVAITAANRGKLAAESVQVEMTIPNEDGGVLLMSEYDYPYRPPSTDMFMAAPMHVPSVAASRILSIEQTSRAWHVTLSLGTLQPGREHWHGRRLYVGALTSRAVPIRGRVYADNLPVPGTCELMLDLVVESRTLPLRELMKMKVTPDKLR